MDGTSSALDTAYRILADSRRRAMIDILDAEKRPLTLHDLVKELADRECDVPITDLSKEELTGIHLSLHHVHVPALADAGFVEYDRKRTIVEPTAELDRLVALGRGIEPGHTDESWPNDRIVS